jgi:RNA polymerase sigma-70 factor (ECF subfamily)
MLLSEDQQKAILLTSLTPLNYEEVATACNVPVGTIRSRLSRGRTTLRKLIAMVPPRHGLPRATGRITVDGSAPA